jgi:hypothetical protein
MGSCHGLSRVYLIVKYTARDAYPSPRPVTATSPQFRLHKWSKICRLGRISPVGKSGKYDNQDVRNRQPSFRGFAEVPLAIFAVYLYYCGMKRGPFVEPRPSGRTHGFSCHIFPFPVYGVSALEGTKHVVFICHTQIVLSRLRRVAASLTHFSLLQNCL